MDVRSAVANYLAVVRGAVTGEPDWIARVKSSLDELAFIAGRVPDRFDAREYPDPPDASVVLWDAVAGRLPAQGFYQLRLTADGRSEVFAASAVEDIAEIARDLQDVLWRFDNTSADDALFHFRTGYQSHWGLHLRCLQLYLHDL